MSMNHQENANSIKATMSHHTAPVAIVTDKI